ncbi:MAG: aminotransferase class V-fold PLP-dependent enzyme [Actinomycetia bacterium]|nr:aminotransferase class V-fold PLP-dependent enzyme [Actinomycetes bacterium]
MAEIDLQTPELDALRAAEFAHLDRDGHRYFDYTGSGLAQESQLVACFDLLRETTLGNPHSHNPTSTPSTELMEAARKRVLGFFNAADHECVFTPNATGAIKLVGEAFPFGGDRPYVWSADNHNSVNGIREYARSAGAPMAVAPLLTPELRPDVEATRALLANPPGDSPGLFAFPAQSNYSGVQHPLELVAEARDLGWRVLLDTAAFAPTNRLDLSEVEADFACVSFYKMFGFPTGVGALVARRDALAELERPAFAGGTISMVSIAADAFHLVGGHAGFEDGTPNFASIPGITIGLDAVEAAGIESIHRRVPAATETLLDGFSQLAHANGNPVVALLGPADATARGGTIAFNIVDRDGTQIHDRRVQELATAAGISLRSGCFCNPGCGEAAHGLTEADMEPFFERPDPPDFCDLDDTLWETRGSGASALRASVGWATDAADIEALLSFVAGFRDHTEAEMGRPSASTEIRGPDSP